MLTQEEYDDIFPLFMMFVAPWCRTKTNARVCGQWEVVDFRSITGEKQIIQL